MPRFKVQHVSKFKLHRIRPLFRPLTAEHILNSRLLQIFYVMSGRQKYSAFFIVSILYKYTTLAFRDSKFASLAERKDTHAQTHSEPSCN